MAYVLSSVSGNLISAASAGFAPTNSADVSAIASAYQVVSATATQLYAGTAYVTSINEAPVSAERAGNAANASLATSAYYDGTGRLISSLPDSAAVSAIASGYAESAASSKLDSSASSSFYSIDNPSGFLTAAYTPTFGYNTADQISSIDGSALGGMDEAAVSGIASAYAESAVSSVSGNYYTTANESGFLTAQVQASWSESASASPSYIVDKPDLVDIVAGPGIVVDNPDGNTLRVSMATDYEVTLFETTFANAVGGDVTLSENAANFDQLRITYIIIGSSQSYAPLSTELVDVSTFSDGFSYFTLNQVYMENGGTNTAYFIIRTAAFGIEGNKLKFKNAVGTSDFGSKAALASSTAKILKVVGIHRIQGGN